MDEGAKRAIDSFARGLKNAFDKTQFNREELLARDTRLHAETKYYLEKLALKASEITNVVWSFNFGSVGYDGGGESTTIVAFPMKNSSSSFPFRIIYWPDKISVVGAINGEQPRDGDGKWNLLTEAFQAVIVQR